jgi:hypothetical protein
VLKIVEGIKMKIYIPSGSQLQMLTNL